MIEIIDGDLYQWDSGRKIRVEENVKEVHFGCCLNNESLAVDVVDGIANIPNILLQRSLNIIVWCFDGYRTIHEATIHVKAKNKPSDYVYTETEVKRL